MTSRPIGVRVRGRAGTFQFNSTRVIGKSGLPVRFETALAVDFCCRLMSVQSTPPAVAPFAIGGTVYAGALVTGPLTGDSFNPARSLVPAVVGGIWTVHWLYWLAQSLVLWPARCISIALFGVRAEQ